MSISSCSKSSFSSNAAELTRNKLERNELKKLRNESEKSCRDLSASITEIQNIAKSCAYSAVELSPQITTLIKAAVIYKKAAKCASECLDRRYPSEYEHVKLQVLAMNVEALCMLDMCAQTLPEKLKESKLPEIETPTLVRSISEDAKEIDGDKAPKLIENKSKKIKFVNAGAGEEVLDEPVESVTINEEDSHQLVSLLKNAAKKEDSIKKSSEILAKFIIHPRVQVWFDSIESGIKSRELVEASDEVKNNAILGHRLPKCLLVLTLNSQYGIKKTVTLPSGITVKNHFESCLLIDGKKYMLETSIGDDNVVYHFWARPQNSFDEFLTVSTFDDTFKVPVFLKEEGFETIRPECLVFDKDNNASCMFDERTYTLAALSKKLA